MSCVFSHVHHSECPEIHISALSHVYKLEIATFRKYNINMIITVASHKGGAGKTTTAVHIAACLQQSAPTLLLDGDDTRNATAWSQNGPGFPFKVADEIAAARLARDYEHTVIDTGQRPKKADLEALVSRGLRPASYPNSSGQPRCRGPGADIGRAKRSRLHQLSCSDNEGSAATSVRRHAVAHRSQQRWNSAVQRRCPAAEML